ncbi:MAG: UvrD-helicase domain-containing protein [Bacteroidales bacterium]|nr:UvrD-helicase domain-containing protein [Bacteroidales bacterium]
MLLDANLYLCKKQNDVYDFLKDLNSEQHAAAVHVNGPALIIAGAGSGKTRVLTYRIAHLLSLGVNPSSILALTFTNKAAREMKDRIGNLVGTDVAQYLWMGTFHSMLSRILRKEGELLGYTKNFTIYDTTDSRSLVKSIIKELQLDDQFYKVNEIYGRISAAKNNLITPQAYYANAQLVEKDQRARRPRIVDIYKMYASRCKRADAMDFDDLLLNTVILFRDFPDVLQKYQEKFRYVLVDEYQDTNYVQYLIVKQLGKTHNNVCVVGDDAQSIYSFRGAKIENILNFKRDYPGCKTYKLEQNYRSTQNIVNAANSIIEKNTEQLRKKVFSKNEAGDKIKVIKAFTDNEEGMMVTNGIMDILMENQLKYEDFAILYRTNAQSRIFEETLRRKNIPYKVYGSLSFYQRKEIKDILAYCRLIVNPNDDEAFKRIINYPARGIGDTTVGKLEDFANQANVSLWKVLTLLDQPGLNLNAGTKSKLSGFYEFIHSFQQKADLLDAYQIALSITNASGIMNEFKHDKTPENISRFENIEELMNSIKEYTDKSLEAGEPATLDLYLANVALLTDQDTDKAEDKNKVKIMTIHASKGLEFMYVFLAGVEEDLFPSRQSAASMKDMEEERRLFYVAITRAEKGVIISHAQTRYKWGTPTSCTPSRFLRDIHPSYIEMSEEKFFETYEKDEIENKPFEWKKKLKPDKTDTIITTPPISTKKLLKVKDATIKMTASTHADEPSVTIIPGMQVEHDRFGRGKVLQVEGSAPNTKATVFFKNHGQKQLLLKFAKLIVIG